MDSGSKPAQKQTKIFTTRSSACQRKSQDDPESSTQDSKNGENVETFTCNANSLMPINSKLSDSLETIYLKDKENKWFT